MPSYTISTIVHNNATQYNMQRKLVRTSNGDLHCSFIKVIDSYQQLFYAKSTDGGENWVETQLTTEAFNQYYSGIAVDSNDYIHIVFSGKFAGPNSTYWQIRYIKYTDSWQTIINLTSGVNDQGPPSIAIDSNDYLHVIWVGGDISACYYLRYIKYTDSWQTIINLTPGVDIQSFSSIAIDSNDYLHIVFVGCYPNSLVYMQLRYIKYTDSWQPVENLTSGDYHQYRPSIAIDSNDYLHIVWYGFHSGSPSLRQVRYIRYTDSWQSIEELTSENYYQDCPSIAIDSNDYIYVVWYGKNSISTTFDQIRYIKYTDSWQAIENLTSAADHQRNPGLIWALYPIINGAKTNRPKEGFTFVWTDYTGTNSLKFYKSADLAWSEEELILLQSNSAGTSGASGSLNSQPELVSSIIGTSVVSGSLDLQPGLVGSTNGISGVSGSLDSQPGLVVSTNGISGVSGILSYTYEELQGLSAGTFDTFGSLNIVIQLQSNSAGVSSVSGILNFTGLIQLQSSSVGISNVLGKIYIPIGFYESLVNQLTSYFQDIANINNLIIRYDNDLRATPAENLWCEYNIDFSNAEQSEIGIDSFRNVGNFNVKIKNKIGLGIGELSEKTDIIATAFRRKNLNRIIFEVPKVRNVGRINDDYQMNVICPFFVDKIGK